LGIDIGLKVFLTDSDGNTVANPRHLRKAEKKLKRLHRRLSRTQKKSANRKKARRKLARTYLRVQRQREDFARKTASTLITSCEVIAYEHLPIANLVKNRKLAKAISDASWGQFLRWLKYYGQVHGVAVIPVEPAFTGQTFYVNVVPTFVAHWVSVGIAPQSRTTWHSRHPGVVSAKFRKDSDLGSRVCVRLLSSME
jgi:IS605 OrfB family transposase